jgi:hypothetical protein
MTWRAWMILRDVDRRYAQRIEGKGKRTDAGIDVLVVRRGTAARCRGLLAERGGYRKRGWTTGRKQLGRAGITLPRRVI